MGILLSEAIEKLFGEKLQWFTGNEEPLQVIKIMGFLSEEKTSFLLEELSNVIKH